MKNSYTLYATKGCGSMIVEAAFAFTPLKLVIIELVWDELGWESKALRTLNPLGQVPTLVLPNGQVMTESAAIILHLKDKLPSFALVPESDNRVRPKFLRWLCFIVAAIYPTFTYGDMPQRWVGAPKDKGAGKALRASTDEHRELLLRFLDEQARGPWFLGKQLTALDIYVWVLSQWRPGHNWWAAQCPKLYAIATKFEADKRIQMVAARNKL